MHARPKSPSFTPTQARGGMTRPSSCLDWIFPGVACLVRWCRGITGGAFDRLHLLVTLLVSIKLPECTEWATLYETRLVIYLFIYRGMIMHAVSLLL